jgi:hypothetical protein
MKRAGVAVAVALLSLLGLAACTSTGASVAPSVSTPVAVSAAPSSSAAAASSGGGSATSQTDTDWGRIWDTLPASFPTITGSTRSDEASAGPASAIFTVDGDAAKTVATTLQARLEAGGYTTVALGGPLEDGTFTLDMTGPPTGCMLQIRATPTGGSTTITILYGATCPHD